MLRIQTQGASVSVAVKGREGRLREREEEGREKAASSAVLDDELDETSFPPYPSVSLSSSAP